MSNWDFVRRFKSLDLQLGGGPPDETARVSIEAIPGLYRGSREGAPCAVHFVDLAAGGAGNFNGVMIGGVDPQGANSGLGGRCLVAVHEITMLGQTAQTCAIALLPQASVNNLTLTAATPVIRDVDPLGVTPQISTYTIPSGDLPSGAGTLQNMPVRSYEVGAATAGIFAVDPANDWLPKLWFVSPDRRLFFTHTGANQGSSFLVRWQAIRI